MSPLTIINLRSSVNAKTKKTTRGGGNADQQPVFSIDDDGEDDDGNDADDEDVGRGGGGKLPGGGNDIAEIDTWRSRADMRHCFSCQAVMPDRTLVPAHLFVSQSEMRCLVEVKPRRRGSAMMGRGGVEPKHTWVRDAGTCRQLRAIVRITSRRSFPELITFKFGDPALMEDMSEESVANDKIEVVASHRYIIPDAGSATKAIKQLIVENDREWQQKQQKGEQGEPAAAANGGDHLDGDGGEKPSTSSNAA